MLLSNPVKVESSSKTKVVSIDEETDMEITLFVINITPMAHARNLNCSASRDQRIKVRSQPWGK
jgi:hypothetical protein